MYFPSFQRTRERKASFFDIFSFDSEAFSRRGEALSL
jgi:hypothetical protein